MQILNNTSSSHPTALIRSIPDGVFTSNKELFIQETPYYHAVMDRAGHKEKLTCKVEDNAVETGSELRGRGIIWFNPPWSSNIRTNVGGKFISLVKKHFPLNTIFNLKKLKVSYRTTSNMGSIIKTNNKKILSGR